MIFLAGEAEAAHVEGAREDDVRDEDQLQVEVGDQTERERRRAGQVGRRGKPNGRREGRPTVRAGRHARSVTLKISLINQNNEPLFVCLLYTGGMDKGTMILI